MLTFSIPRHPTLTLHGELTAICNDNCVYFSVTITLNADEFARDQHAMVWNAIARNGRCSKRVHR